jgi:hypothetical protein
VITILGRSAATKEAGVRVAGTALASEDNGPDAVELAGAWPAHPTEDSKMMQTTRFTSFTSLHSPPWARRELSLDGRASTKMLVRRDAFAMHHH